MESERETKGGQQAESAGPLPPSAKPKNVADDGFMIGMLLLLVIGFPLFLASVFFVLYALFMR